MKGFLGERNITMVYGQKYDGEITQREKEILHLDHGIASSTIPIGEGDTRVAYLGFGPSYWMSSWSSAHVCILIEKKYSQSSATTLMNQGKGDLNLREAIALHDIGNHPNVVRLLASDKPEHRRINVQERVQGLNLDLSWSYWASSSMRDNLIYEISEGLSYVHRQGSVHRDLKPSNVVASSTLLNEGFEGAVKLIDFQNACRIGHLEEKCMPTRGGTAFTSIELLNSLVTGKPSHATEKTDVYAFGGVVYKLLTGQDPSRRRFVFDRFWGRTMSFGFEDHRVSLVEVDDNGAITRRLRRGISEKKEEQRIKGLLEEVPQRYRELIYLSMTGGEEGIQDGSQLEEYVRSELIKS